MKTTYKYPADCCCSALPNTSVAISIGYIILRRVAISFILLLCFQSSFGQRNALDMEPDSMIFFHLGASYTSINRSAFDQWTRTNYNLVERHDLNTLIDIGGIYKRFDIGVDLNAGGAFNQYMVYFGRRLTGPRSFITSWLNFEAGEFVGIFKNISPVNYTPTPDQKGQQLELHYTSTYIGLTSKNFLNFLHFNIRLGKDKIPVNTGFFVGAGFQPGGRNWKYGYYNTDTVFTAVKIKNIPRLGKVQVNTGLFMGF
jgi:hypothetical protein